MIDFKLILILVMSVVIYILFHKLEKLNTVDSSNITKIEIDNDTLSSIIIANIDTEKL